MSIEKYYELNANSPAVAHQYLRENFDLIFSEAVEKFSLVGWSAIGLAVVVAVVAVGSWIRLRQQLPWRWLWLLPILIFVSYAGIKSSVIFDLIQRAPELPQMWSLFIRYWTPFKMVRTSVSGLVICSAILWLSVYYFNRRAKTV